VTTEPFVVIFLIFAVVVWSWRQVWRVVRRYRPRIRLGDWMTGTVYIFWDRSMPEESRIVKVGVTQRRDVNKRLEEVRDTMGGDPVCIWKMDHVPYPFAVEFAAHQFLDEYRVLWLKGSRRGTEWFYAVGDRGMARVIGAVEKAARRVRKVAKTRKRWSDKADMYISVWKLSEIGVSRTYPFRQISARVERGPSMGGNVPNKNKHAGASKPTLPLSRTSNGISRRSRYAKR
jgi:T5orf172 domain